MARFPQRVTFIATLEIDIEGMDWATADAQIIQALLDGDNAPGSHDYTLNLVRTVRMERIEED